MKEKFKNLNRNELLQIGFALLLPGIFLATILDSNRILQVIGLVMLVLSSVVFGRVITRSSK